MVPEGPVHFRDPQVRRVVLTAEEMLAARDSLAVFATLLTQHGFDPDRPIHWRWRPADASLTMTQLQEGREEGADA